MIFTLLSAASLVTFPGGSTADLAENVSKATSRNIFITQAFVQPVKPFQYETKSYEDLAFDIRMHAKLHVVPAADLVFEDAVLPPFRMPASTVGRSSPAPQWKSLTSDNIVDGKITFHTKG